MNNGRIWDIVHTVLAKESRGNIIKPGRFSYLLEQANTEYFNQQYEKWSGSQTILDSLRPFVEVDEVLSTTTGTGDLTGLSQTYRNAIGARATSDDALVDIVTPVEWNAWIGDTVMTGTSDYPLAVIDGSNIKVYPTSISSIKFSYLREPATPIFDYYIDANYTVQYLTEGQSEYPLKTGEVGSSGETADTEVTSTSIDLEWENSDVVNIISIILEKLGTKLSAVDITQYAMSLEQKQNVM